MLLTKCGRVNVDAKAIDDWVAVERAGERSDAAHPRSARRVPGKPTLSEEVLQDTQRHAANGMADRVNRVTLVPFWEETDAVGATKARVTAPPRVLLAIVDLPSFDRIEHFARAVVVARHWPGHRGEPPLMRMPAAHLREMPVRVLAQEARDEHNRRLVVARHAAPPRVEGRRRLPREGGCSEHPRRFALSVHKQQREP